MSTNTTTETTTETPLLLCCWCNSPAVLRINDDPACVRHAIDYGQLVTLSPITKE